MFTILYLLETLSSFSTFAKYVHVFKYIHNLNHACTQLHISLAMVLLIVGFEVLRLHYSALVKSMPDDYMNTVSQLESHLSGDHIGSILECRDVFTANQRILDCLIEQICNEQELLNFCDWFSTSINAPLLTVTVENIRKGKL